MPFRKPIRSEQSPTVVDSRLEEPNVFNRGTKRSAFSNGATSGRLPQFERSEPSQISNQGPSVQRLSSTVGNQSQAFINTPLVHPGVGTLLNEYYKLLESASSDSVVVVRSNRYRPSFVMKLWKLLTLTLPTALRYGQYLRQIRTLLEQVAPSSALGIIFSLLMWIVVLHYLLEWPFTCLLTFVFGVCYLLIGEEKYKETVLLKMEPRVQLEGFSVEKDAGAVPLMAKEYVRIRHHRRLVGGTNLNSMEWPNHLSKPDNCIKEEIKEIHEDIQKLRSLVFGQDQQRGANPDTGTSFESAVDSVHEICTLVGLDQTSSEIQDWDSLRNKLQEVQDELGL